MTVVDQKNYRWPETCDGCERDRPCVMAIGEPAQWVYRHDGTPRDYCRMSFADLRGLVTGDDGEITADLVLSPVVAKDFDCIDVALLLTELGYVGAYRAVGRQLPKPDIVMREVKAACPKLDFGILDIGPDGKFVL